VLDNFDRAAVELREALGLTQEEMGAVLGVDKRSISRLETGEAQSQGAFRTALHLLLSTESPRAAGVFHDLARLHGNPDADGLRKTVAAALDRVVATLPSSEQSTAQAGTLRELVACAGRTGRSWVYWATRDRANPGETLALARDHGIICRPVFYAPRTGERDGERRDVQPYLLRLRPGDEVLLCHDAVPQAWFRLVEGDATPPDLHADAPVRDSDWLQASLPRVFKFVPLRSALGKRLAGSGYRLHDGSEVGPRARVRFFSALAVEANDRSIFDARPRPRRQGIRFTMTPYERDDGPRF
jgi:DNA-binding XRE family transcriptional regulator